MQCRLKKEDMNVTDLTKENFEEEVLKAEGYIHGFEEVYGSTIKFCSLNTTKARRLAISQKVLGLPVIAIYKDGLMIDSRVKEDATPDSCEEMIKKYA